MIRRIVCLLLTVAPLLTLAQKQNNIWYFGVRAGLDFNYSPPHPLTDGLTHTNEGTSSIADKNTGSSLFYTDGDTIWDRTNSVMPNGTGLGGNKSSTQSALIVPKPGSNTLYYIFTVDAQVGFYSGGDSGLNYNVVDMTLHGGLGDVTTKYKLLLKPVTEKLTGTLACNGKDVWVMAHEYNTNAFYAYLISDTGIAPPVISYSGATYTPSQYPGAEAIGYMKFSPDGSKLALVSGGNVNELQIFDFNLATGQVSNPVTDAYKPGGGYEGYGTSFSPDNSRLYVSYYSDTWGIYQYNLLAGDSAAIVASRVTIVVDSGRHSGWGALQNGPDGRMYVAKLFGRTGYIDIIANPNGLGAACNFLPNNLLLGDSVINYTHLGLPNQMERSMGYSSLLRYGTCSGTDSISFANDTLRGTVTARWHFGDTASGAADSSTQRFPSHTFSSGGTYTVQVVLTSPCSIDTLAKTVTVSSTAHAAITPQNPSFCFGSGIRLTATGGTTYTWTPAKGLSATTGNLVVADPDTTTRYVVTASINGCSDTATDLITIIPAPSIEFDYTSKGKQVTFAPAASSGGVVSYNWDFGDSTAISTQTNPVHDYARNDTFYACLTVYNNSNCSYTFCKYVNLLETGIENISALPDVQLYPNPAGGQLTVSNYRSAISSIEITNLLGQTLLTQPLLSGSKQTTINVGSLPAGVYLFQVKNENSIVVKKFVKS